MHVPLFAGTFACLLAALTMAQEAAPVARFTNLGHTFQIDLPKGYRQIAPNEALRLAENAATPADLKSTAPRDYYAVGPVDRWLAGDLGSPWLYVMEQDNEWYIEGDFAEELAKRWSQNGAVSGTRHVLSEVRETTMGPLAHPVRTARRSTTDSSGRRIESLDIYASTQGRQITIAACAWADDFERWAPEFQKWLASLTFARPPRGQQSLSDRLWTPLLTGGLVALVLFVLYKHTHRAR